MTSQVTFEEFKAIVSSCYLYNAKHNPLYALEQRLDKLNPSRDWAKAKMPDNFAQSDEFHERSEALYNRCVQQHLLGRTWFTKVDALELFTASAPQEFRGLASNAPQHSVYTPVQHNILPRPKFWRHTDEDTGEDFTYRDRDGHYAPGVYDTNLRPTGWTPAIGAAEATYKEEYQHRVAA